MIMEKIVAQAQLMGTGNKESIAGFDISLKMFLISERQIQIRKSDGNFFLSILDKKRSKNS